MTSPADSSDLPACDVRIWLDERKPQVHRVTKFPCRIGRLPDCDLVINEPSVSGRHALLRLNAKNRLELEDTQSTNGTRLNGDPIVHIAVDRDLDLELGDVRVQIAPAGGAARAGGGGRSSRAAEQDKCLYRRRGREYGPFSRTQLEAMADDGTLHRSDLVWIPGATGWLRAEFVPGLFSGRRRMSEGPALVEDEPEPAAAPAPESPAPRPKPEATRPPPPAESRSLTCPHCWHRFAVEEFLFIARHQSLVGDPVLGPEAQQRFLPSRFTPEGNAIDSMGTSCPDKACPHCHLRIPQTASEMPPLFLSIVGATASGKSYFLTSMTWTLRNAMAKNFAISFTDTDAVNNQILNDFEESLYLASNPDALVALRKTELQGELYNQVLLNGMIINLPKPFMFSVVPAEHHPNYDEVRAKMSRTLVLYDNAGEHFEPGMDSVDNPTTQHLLHSDTIFFLFDPTKDVRVRSAIQGSADPQMAKGARVQRQEIILTEMINRIKKYSGMRAGTKTGKTLVVLVSKCDIWMKLLGEALPDTPWQYESRYHTCGLDVDLIKNVSFQVRALLARTCPEMVSTAESFAGDVLYLPNSALGRSPELSPDTGMLGIRSQDVKPFWAEVPMLYFFWERGFIRALPRQRRRTRETVPIEYKLSGDVVFVSLPGQDKPLEVPVFYLGTRLRCPGTDQWFDLPLLRRPRRKDA